MSDPTRRFSNRVAYYVEHRPGYPASLMGLLERRCGLAPGMRVADMGCGTGLMAVRFLEAGCRVIGIEPNAEMRAAGDQELSGYSGFKSRDGTAERTGLPDASVDLVSAGQAFHWFDLTLAGAEFRRILVPGGWVILVWNERRDDADRFHADYQALLKEFGTDYEQVAKRRPQARAMREFLGPSFWSETLPNHQRLDHSGLAGRLLSTSYVPAPGEPRHDAMMAALARIHQNHQRDGQVTIHYDCRVYGGRFDA